MSSRGHPISDSNANDPASRPAAPAGLRWGGAEAPAPQADRSSASGEREVKGLFGVGKVPPPAGASLAGAPNADPLASLFAADTVVKAPGIQDAPSEAELGRWRATMQSSLFEERVVDPAPAATPTPMPEPREPPAAPAPPPRALAAAAPPRAEAARLAPPPRLAPAPIAAPSMEPDDVEDRLPARRAPEPRLDPPAPLPTQQPRSNRNTSKRRRAAAAAEAAAPAPEAAVPPRRRRFERGPSKALLVALGIAAASAVAALAIVLGPSGSDDVAPAPAAPPPVAPAAPPAQPAAPAAAAAQPTAADAPGAAAPAEPAAVAAAAPTAAAKPAAASPSAAPAPEVQDTSAASDDEPSADAPAGLLRAAREALSADDAPGAEKIARQALGVAPQDHHAMELLVLALMDQDRGQEALPFARRMVQRRSRRVPYRLLLGDLLLMVGDEAAARAEWQKALALSPGDKQIKRRLGL